MGIKFNPFTGNLDIVNNPSIDGRVVNFASLPLASTSVGKIYLVETSTGVAFINRRPKGLYISDGTDWALMPSSMQADKSLYDNSVSGLSASNVQDAINEVNVKATDFDWLKTDGSKSTSINDDIYTNGNVGIGTTAPTQPLNVNGKADVDGVEIYSGEGTGNYNIGIGSRNFDFNTVGNSNIAIGRQAMRNNILGAANIGIGVNALNSNFNGGSNIALSLNALLNNTTGGNNVALGPNALSTPTSSSNNIAIGNSALRNMTTGRENVGIGVFSGNFILGQGSSVTIRWSTIKNGWIFISTF